MGQILSQWTDIATIVVAIFGGVLMDEIARAQYEEWRKKYPAPKHARR